jgi:ribonuclease BN (tRNA processing enzyme)
MEGFIKFFGTGGARFVVSSQLRATGGLWLRYKETNLYIDPGPGAIVRIQASRDGLEPAALDGIILTHKHLDHSNDVNVLIEAMTEGGFKGKGVLFCPGDALGGDPVVRSYVKKYLDRIELLQAGASYRIKDVTFTTPVRHIHPVATYGLLFHLNRTIAMVTDTRFFDELPDHYHADYLIVNVLRTQPIKESDVIDHLSIHDFRKIVERVNPELAVMTHFGTNMIKENPEQLAKALSEEMGLNIIAAYDGMKLEF